VSVIVFLISWNSKTGNVKYDGAAEGIALDHSVRLIFAVEILFRHFLTLKRNVPEAGD
jgi:hypothetical protein